MAAADLGDLYMQGVEAVPGEVVLGAFDSGLGTTRCAVGCRRRRFCASAARRRASAGKLPAPGPPGIVAGASPGRAG